MTSDHLEDCIGWTIVDCFDSLKLEDRTEPGLVFKMLSPSNVERYFFLNGWDDGSVFTVAAASTLENLVFNFKNRFFGEQLP